MWFYYCVGRKSSHRSHHCAQWQRVHGTAGESRDGDEEKEAPQTRHKQVEEETDTGSNHGEGGVSLVEIS